jgi:N4-gp56 family major capsid protein
MPLAKTTSVRTTTAATNLSKLLMDIYLAKNFVKFLRANLVAAMFGDEEELPMHSGKSTRWLFHNALTAATTALGEGDDPSDSRATTTNFVEGTIATYGDFIEFTEELEDYSHPQTMAQYSELVGEQAARTLDTLVHTQSLNASTTSVGPIAAMTADLLRQASSKLRKNNARPHPRTPGGRFFAFVASVEQADDMYGEGTPKWFEVKTPYHFEALEELTPRSGEQANDSGSPVVDRAGLYSAVVYASTNVQADTAATPNDLGALIAANSFGISSFETNILKPKVNVVEPVPSLSSPLGRRGLISWKAKFVSKLFDSNRIIVVKTNIS